MEQIQIQQLSFPQDTMAQLHAIHSFLNEHFQMDGISDVALNGIQIEGGAEISKLVVAVDAGLSLIESALARKADMLLVHHGIFWGKPWPVAGVQKQLLNRALNADLSLYAIHLPLDAHPIDGNSALLAALLEASILAPAADFMGTHCGLVAGNTKSLTLDDIVERLATLDGAQKTMLSLPFGPKIPKKICIVSGAGCEQLTRFLEDDFDTFISGEPRQFAYHFCKANKINAIFPGHYATETLGVQACAKLLEQQFKLDWEYVSEPSGI